MKKKKLAVIYDPHNLLQFIWYYSTYKSEYEWDALCLPNGSKGEYMSKHCEKSGIFTHVISNSKAYLDASLIEQLKIFFKMFIFFCIGKQEEFCKELANDFVCIDDYEEIVVLTDHGLVASAFIGLSKEKNIVILEDGKGDYMHRSNKNILQHLFSPFDWKGFLIANMGYANTGHRYPLRTTKCCVKYCSHPEKMLYRDYKSIHKLYDYDSTDMVLYNSIIEKIYGNINQYNFESIDTVIFTCNIADFTNNTEKYMDRIVEYVNVSSKNILLKKHPRDIMNYQFSSNIITNEVNTEIPAEVLLPYIRDKKVIFMYTSALMLYIDSNEYDVECIYFNDLHEKSEKESTYFTYICKDDFKKELQELNITNAKILDF